MPLPTCSYNAAGGPPPFLPSQARSARACPGGLPAAAKGPELTWGGPRGGLRLQDTSGVSAKFLDIVAGAESYTLAHSSVSRNPHASVLQQFDSFGDENE